MAAREVVRRDARRGGGGTEGCSCNAAAFCFLYVASCCWFLFLFFSLFFLLFFPFNCNAYLRPLFPTLSLSLLLSLGIVCRRNFWLS